jgi:hypothetical protein
MKKYVTGGTRKGEQKKRLEPADIDVEGKDIRGPSCLRV